MERGSLELELPHPVVYERAWLRAAGAFLPGEPIGNDRIDAFIAPLNGKSERIKRRVLHDNGIETRHYAIDEAGHTRHSVAAIAAAAARDCLERAGVGIERVSLLCTGSSGGDTGMPGFANMLHGELGAAPLETSSHQGVCAAGVAALKHAAAGVELGEHRYALVATGEMPSRLFKKSRFAVPGYDADFDAHFLRWMLSDGGGAVLLSSEPPAAGGVALKLKWIHMRSFSGDFPVCMQVGFAAGGSQRSYLDYDSLSEAERAGAFLLRQDIRLLPHLFDVGVHEYARLAAAGYVDPGRVDHFLCHYSSEKFRGVVAQLMDKAGLAIAPERWYSNLKWRGNTGAASIFIMLADFLRERRVEAGERIFCFVPESGRFTVSYLMLEAVRVEEAADPEVAPPHPALPGADPLQRLLRDLANVWQHYRSRMWRTRLVRHITRGELTDAELRRWMECWIPQVREGTLWMRRAIDNLDARYDDLRDLIATHAGEEQFDYRMLFEDYRRAGGEATHIDALRRNAGGEALNAYMHTRATAPNPLGLLGAIYIIEGTGQRIIPALMPMLRRQQAGRVPEFLRYHGENDARHLERWLQAVAIVVDRGGEVACRDIVETARATADLYALQMECVI